MCVNAQFSDLRNIISGVPQGSVLEPLLFIIHTNNVCKGLENKLVSYADDGSLMSVVQYPTNRSLVAESLNRDLDTFYHWCKIWGIR